MFFQGMTWTQSMRNAPIINTCVIGDRQEKWMTIITSQSVQECQPSENFQQTIVICQKSNHKNWKPATTISCLIHKCTNTLILLTRSQINKQMISRFFQQVQAGGWNSIGFLKFCSLLFAVYGQICLKILLVDNQKFGSLKNFENEAILEGFWLPWKNRKNY